MNKSLIGLIAILIIGAGAWYFLGQNNTGSMEAGGDAMLQASDYKWTLTDLGEHPSVPGMPRTGVMLSAGGKSYDAGSFDGSCSEIAGSSWNLVEGEVTGVICWWAGGGSEIGVFNEGGKAVLKVGVLDEGSEEVPPVRGGYKTVISL